MSPTKTNLKLARESISKKDHTNTKKYSLQVLDFEPDSYHALVFLGVAHLELGEYEECEQTYRKATELLPTQVLAWQGLAQLYERQEDWERYPEILNNLLKLFNKEQDAVKCAETLQKIVDLRRKHGTPPQLINALTLYLPESEFYPVLSTLPPSDPANPALSTTFDAQNAIHNGFHVLQEILALAELREEDTFNDEVKKERTRLGGAGPEQIKKDVVLKISNQSQIPALYDAILNHPSTSDELRVDIEAKQLLYKHRHLCAIPSDQEQFTRKRQLLKEVDDMVNTIVLLHKPSELGWKFYFEGWDCEDMSGYDREHVRDYINLFPHSALSDLFMGFFAYTAETLWPEDHKTRPQIDIPVDTVLNASLKLSDTILGNRLAAVVYLAEQDYESAMKSSKHGLRNLQQFENDTGKKCRGSRTALQVILATALVHFFPPKHHKEASRIIEDILNNSPLNKDAWIARAFIFEAESQWNAAIEAFDQAANLFGEDTLNALRAVEEGAWCRSQAGEHEEALRSLEHVFGLLNDIDDERMNYHRARCLWRIGKCTLASNGCKTEESYKFFVQALKKDSEFAPAYTSLGIYYIDQASPPDVVRSSKCFQKAFELDPRETEAAKRLVEGFANDKEWDLVEVVAERTIDGEGGLDAGLDKTELDARTKYLPTNVWAWKALGIVRFNYKDYPAAIQAFQVYLRVNPDDEPLWVRLGEAYAKAGRHTAAVKALNHALELNPDDWVCKYFIAEVKHEMGMFEDTISLLRGICSGQFDEAGPFVLLGQGHLDLGLTQLADGFQIRAEESFLSAVQVALDIIMRMSGFRLPAWKMIGDAAIHLSNFSTLVTGDAISNVLDTIPYLATPDWAEKIVSTIGLFSGGAPLTPLTIVMVAIRSYLSQISLSIPGQATNQAGWYDLGVSLQMWNLLAPKSTPPADIRFIKDEIIECFRKALQADPSNDMYWIALGNAYFIGYPKAAQHAYIKALEMDSKNAGAWVNLGLLYFHHLDVELANEALYRAQVLDPDNTEAWVGQFLVARANRDKADATVLLEHAVGLSRPVAEADYELAFRVFNATTKERQFHRVLDALLPAFFLLNKYCQKRPNDPTALHLLSLICERLGHHARGAEFVERSISMLEAAYEELEDPEVELRYTIANCTLGRLRLSLGQYNEAAGSFGSAQGLLVDKDSSSQIVILRTQVHVGLALSKFFCGDLESSLGFLEEGLQIANDDLPLRSQLVICQAQILWSIGSDEARETAKSRLLECIASDPENLSAINALAGMGILTADDSLIDAALSEILALPMEQKHSLDPQKQVDYLLLQNHLAQQDTKQAASVARHAVYSEPGNLEQRNQLATLVLRDGCYKEGHALLVGAEEVLSSFMTDAEALNSALNLQAIALACQAVRSSEIGQGEPSLLWQNAVRKVQKAILLRPWKAKGWQTLAYVRSTML